MESGKSMVATVRDGVKLEPAEGALEGKEPGVRVESGSSHRRVEKACFCREENPAPGGFFGGSGMAAVRVGCRWFIESQVIALKQLATTGIPACPLLPKGDFGRIRPCKIAGKKQVFSGENRLRGTPGGTP